MMRYLIILITALVLMSCFKKEPEVRQQDIVLQFIQAGFAKDTTKIKELVSEKDLQKMEATRKMLVASKDNIPKDIYKSAVEIVDLNNQVELNFKKIQGATWKYVKEEPKSDTTLVFIDFTLNGEKLDIEPFKVVKEANKYRIAICAPEPDVVKKNLESMLNK